ncbi:14152_t:CDS:2, partial [Entrophospora sp. SA101]
PFGDQPHDIDLAFKICGGLRPSFSDNTPKCYIELAYKCTDADPEKRPTANEILEAIAFWKDAISMESLKLSKYSYSEEQIDSDIITTKLPTDENIVEYILVSEGVWQSEEIEMEV